MTAKRYRSECSQHRGFSLIELLVVVSIVALLVGILVPTLGLVREASKSAQCLTTVRQLSIALVAYSADNDDHYINYRQPNEQSSHRYWDVDAVDGDWWSSRLVAQDYLPSARSFACPSLDTTVDDLGLASLEPTASNPHGSGGVVWNKVHYGMNVRFLGSKQGWQFPPAEGEPADSTDVPEQIVFNETPRYSDIVNPSETISHTDSKNRAIEVQAKNSGLPQRIEGIGYLFPAYDPPEIQYGYSHARHSNAINIAWADGSGSSMGIVDVDDPYGPDELTSVPDQPDENLWDLQ